MRARGAGRQGHGVGSGDLYRRQPGGHLHGDLLPARRRRFRDEQQPARPADRADLRRPGGRGLEGQSQGLMPLIPCQRSLFDIKEATAYLDCAKMSPLSRSAIEAGRRGLERKAHPWEVRAEHFFDESEQVRALFARLIGAAADDVAIVPSVSYAMATVMANVPIAAGQKIVTLADDFPSGILASRALARRAEARVVTVARPEAGDWKIGRAHV